MQGLHVFFYYATAKDTKRKFNTWWVYSFRVSYSLQIQARTT